MTKVKSKRRIFKLFCQLFICLSTIYFVHQYDYHFIRKATFTHNSQEDSIQAKLFTWWLFILIKDWNIVCIYLWQFASLCSGSAKTCYTENSMYMPLVIALTKYTLIILIANMELSITIFVGSLLYSALRGISPGTPVFPSPQKPTFDLFWVNFNLQCSQLVPQHKKTWHLNKTPCINLSVCFVSLCQTQRRRLVPFHSKVNIHNCSHHEANVIDLFESK